MGRPTTADDYVGSEDWPGPTPAVATEATEGEIWMVEWMLARWSESPSVILESLEDSGAPESILSLVRDRIET